MVVNMRSHEDTLNNMRSTCWGSVQRCISLCTWSMMLALCLHRGVWQSKVDRKWIWWLVVNVSNMANSSSNGTTSTRKLSECYPYAATFESQYIYRSEHIICEYDYTQSLHYVMCCFNHNMLQLEEPAKAAPCQVVVGRPDVRWIRSTMLTHDYICLCKRQSAFVCVNQ